MTSPKSALNITIFWDVENVSDDLATHRNMTEKIKQTGNVVKAYAFADWDTRRQMAIDLYQLGYDLLHVPDTKDNASDYKMASYILDHLIHYPKTSRYVLVTGDGDFKLLAGALKERGVDIWLISNPIITASELHDIASTYSDIFSFRPGLDCVNPEDCDESVQSIVQLRHLAAVQLQEVIRLITNTGNKPGVGHAKHVMTSLNPDFNENDLGFKHWHDFLDWAEAEGYIKHERDLPSSLLKLPTELPPHSVTISTEVSQAFAFIAKVAEDSLTEGKPISLMELGTRIRQLGLEFEKIGYRRFSDFVLAAEKRGIIRIFAPKKEGESPIVLPVYTIEHLQDWFEENVERIFGASVNVPKAPFLKKISQTLLETQTSLSELENYLTAPPVKNAYSVILQASDIPFLPPYQQSLAHILIGKGIECNDVVTKVNLELSPLGIKLQCPT
ncbi:MAG: NYN domain-containing protein [Candidatus Thorarchaeota archaeon]|nr:NYN domain-containing protein [Candidatus Thorarchaeota archaeon]